MAQSTTRSSAECCNTCIGKTSNAPYSYDPVIFDQCTSVTGGVCCFECGSLGDPIFGDTVSYGDDGVTAVVKAGTFISFTWSGVSNVTYISLKKGQKKIITPTITDTAADVKSNTFLICARSEGIIYFRGWGSDPCREASPEHSVTVEAGGSGANTCNANDVVVPTSPSTEAESGSGFIPKDDTVDSCNPQRASIQVVDGTRTCVCVSDWTNPPECDRWPVWKWLVTVGGGVAALFSIIISVRAFLAGRKKKEKEELEETLAPMGSKNGVETMTVTPESGFHDGSKPSYQYNPETDRTTGPVRKAEDREFTL
ncbi:hypothetical protein F443_12529 [Plasmopara halstedii]|uniref:Uncharacterized protein n=1 Tax=Plasmopara halstedii TaxID=4781 RepID=A0A0P1AYL8_PLAHL|nr:hypothetical protein F443_12529 [Plasmopara halstedii]CEG45960.1 hypothetical protein F443_12529 [Plasmopara halstedii]|eukprot:XP_024582329.1 hypothetical protein F443_12529 [Plasmopara halstedii]